MSTKHILDPYRAVQFILDFVGTLTEKDTLENLVEIAKDSSGDYGRIDDAWAECKELYMQDRATIIKGIDLRDSTTAGDESTILKHLESVEIQSIYRVSHSGIFLGLTEQHILDGAARQREKPNGVRLRTAVQDLLNVVNARKERLRQNGEDITDHISILSVNWSRTWIYGCLKSQLDNFEEYNINKSSIYSNELDGLHDSEHASNGVIAGRIYSSRNKLQHLTNIRQINSRSPVIYIGDSWTDFECLIDAELGICIGKPDMEKSELSQSFKRIGLDCPHISKMDDCDSRNVVWARDFSEITLWLYRNS